nr:amidohydrolase [Nocardioides panaciterrulae]
MTRARAGHNSCVNAHIFLQAQLFDGHRYAGADALGVRDGRIVAIGDPADVRDRVGPGAQEVDCGGGLLLPGFQDAHMHPMVGGLERLRCEMSGLSGAEEYLDALRDSAERQSGAAWFRGGGWSVAAFGPQGPTAELLDRVMPDKPAFLPSTDHHDAWVNTRALEVAGITADTPDPEDGWIERDDRGNPTGTLREGAQRLVWDHVETTREEYAAALREAQSYLASWGIVGWHDALIGGYAGLDDPTQAYLDLKEADDLRAHVRCSQWWDRHRGLEQVEELLAERDRLAAAGLTADSVKVMMDGIAETFTATVEEPYLGQLHCACGDRGLAFLDAEQVREVVVALDAAGLACHFHAIGERAVHDALDALEAARVDNGMRGLRHQVAHLQLVRPGDRARFWALGVTANVQGMWVSRDTPAVKMLLPHLDEERASWHYPLAEIAGTGAHLAGGSDWPVNPPEPVAGVHALVNRASYSSDGDAPEPLVPDQALSLEQALSAYTSGTAWVNHRGDSGVLQVGARADLTLLDRDPFRAPAEEIGAAEIVATWFGGERVYER